MQTQNLDLRALCERVAEELDISPSKYREAVSRYETVGSFIKEGQYGDAGTPEIYPQGSFRLGTIIRPIKQGEEADYDVDIVCQFHQTKERLEPGTIKNIIGDRLKENGTYAKMIDDEGRRCWTLNYAEKDGIGFHIDLLPSTEEDIDKKEEYYQKGLSYDIAFKAIAITDKQDNAYEWLGSNPNGYAEWFWSKQSDAFNKASGVQKRKLFFENRALFTSDSDVPDLLVRTPLQRAIQILKRHRDIRFCTREDECYKPVSIIITTLATLLYNNEDTTYDALRSIVNKIQAYSILTRGGTLTSLQKLIKKSGQGEWVIANPVCPDENFADKWHQDKDARAIAFFNWIDWVVQDIQELEAREYSKAEPALIRAFGKQITSKIYNENITVSSWGAVPSIVVQSGQPWRSPWGI